MTDPVAIDKAIQHLAEALTKLGEIAKITFNVTAAVEGATIEIL